MTEVTVVDYYDENCPNVVLTLDSRLSPSQNAQRYYKKYNKCKSAETHLREQIDKGREELRYLDTVFDSLTRAETENDLNEIRRELYESGYASRMKNYTAAKMSAPKPLEFRTSGGWRVLCGKNNAQNDYITHKVASKGDIWFHIKDYPGSHVVLLCDGAEPDAHDFTEAATDGTSSRNILSLLPALTQKRELFDLQLSAISEAVTDLMLLKKNDDARLTFFPDRERAIELCDRCSMSFLYKLSEAVLEAIHSNQRNANVRLTAVEMFVNAGLI
jgi:hypothetical protein